MFLENWKRLQMRLGYFWDLTGIEEEEVSPLHTALGPCFSLILEIDALKQRVSKSFPSQPLSPAEALMVCWLCHGLSALRWVQMFLLGVQILPLSC